ncbi:(2Fe-2S)-binding protein [Mesorhizobium xinjiangense]|uniref:(2Fe-2S)-binding protein n=1 Tax=Mesorhizobium xinjiangense TaxID=2678685 RepID=UPI0018DD8121|nr:(2Fe-2S)-binding protein [Mesorhizobium xinjiangense]
MNIRLTINGEPVAIDTDPDKPLLWVLREDLKLIGTKYGCGIGACGACTVHVDGLAMRSCVLPVEAVAQTSVTTIEGLADEAGRHALQSAWIANQVPQCGYCQSGMIMAAAALLKDNPRPSDDEIDAAMTNLCRCGTYPRVRRAIRAVADDA